MAQTVYDLLRVLIERQGWQSEQQKREWLDTVARAEQGNVFGSRAIDMRNDEVL